MKRLTSPRLFAVAFAGGLALMLLLAPGLDSRAGAQAPGATPAGWLANADHEEPSPVLTSLKGAGTANANADPPDSK